MQFGLFEKEGSLEAAVERVFFGLFFFFSINQAFQ